GVPSAAAPGTSSPPAGPSPSAAISLKPTLAAKPAIMAASSPLACRAQSMSTSSTPARSIASAVSWAVSTALGSLYKKFAQYAMDDETPRASNSGPSPSPSAVTQLLSSTSRGGLLAIPWMKVTCAICPPRLLPQRPPSPYGHIKVLPPIAAGDVTWLTTVSRSSSAPGGPRGSVYTVLASAVGRKGGC